MRASIKPFCIAVSLFLCTALFQISRSAEKSLTDVLVSNQNITAVMDESGSAQVHLQTTIDGLDKTDLLIRCVIREKATGKEIAFSRTFHETGRTVGKDSLCIVTVSQDIDMEEPVRKSAKYEAVTDVYVRARPPKTPPGVRIQMIPAKEIHTDTFIKTFKFKTK